MAYFRSVPSKVFTGAVPFSNSPPTAAIFQIMQATRPPRPTHPDFTEDLWMLMQRCWNQDPKMRPNASEVLQAITLSLCKRLVNRTLPTQDRARMITVVFSKQDQAKMARQVPREEVQNLIDVIYGVSPHRFSCGRCGSDHTFYQLGLRHPYFGHSKEVPVLLIQDLWPRSAGPEANDDTALFQSQGEPVMSQ